MISPSQLEKSVGDPSSLFVIKDAIGKQEKN